MSTVIHPEPPAADVRPPAPPLPLMLFLKVMWALLVESLLHPLGKSVIRIRGGQVHRGRLGGS